MYLDNLVSHNVLRGKFQMITEASDRFTFKCQCAVILNYVNNENNLGGNYS